MASSPSIPTIARGGEGSGGGSGGDVAEGGDGAGEEDCGGGGLSVEKEMRLGSFSFFISVLGSLRSTRTDSSFGVLSH